VRRVDNKIVTAAFNERFDPAGIEPPDQNGEAWIFRQQRFPIVARDAHRHGAPEFAERFQQGARFARPAENEHLFHIFSP
jgi:hypothetical protein